MKSYSSREVLKIIQADGWYFVGQNGDHLNFKHPTKPGKVTVTHPRNNIPVGTLRNIGKQTGIKFK